MPYKNSKDSRKRLSNIKYDNTEKGFITNRIASIYTKTRIKRRGYFPKITKQEVWAELLLHVEKMKDLFPETDGRVCRYCFKPWTYIALREKNKDKKNSNFSIDRLDNDRTYEKGNIIFCCHQCNDTKHSITFKLIDRIQEIRNES